MVIVNDALKPGFRRAMKRNGAMLAKGRLLGVQFAAAMAHDLWLELGRHADAQAQRIAAALSDRGIAMYVPSPTNQIFPILSDAQIARLQEQVAFYTTARVDAAHQAVRFVTSWATTDAQVDALLACLLYTSRSRSSTTSRTAPCACTPSCSARSTPRRWTWSSCART